MLMLFTKLRGSMKGVVILVTAAFIVTMFYGVFGSRTKNNVKVEDAIAKVDGQSISREEFTRNYYNYAQSQEQSQGPIPGDSVLKIKSGMLDQMVDRALLLKAAKDAKTKVDKAVVDKEYDRIKNQFPTKDAFSEALTQNSLTEKSLREMLKESKLLSAFEADKRKTLKVTNADLAKAYEEVKASHILIQFSDTVKAADAKVKAEKALAEVKAGGDFAAIAKKYSDDSGSKAAGGDVGFFGRGKMVPEFEKAAFAMEVGDVSGLVKSKFGYHIIKVTDRKEAKGKDFIKAKKALKKTALDAKYSKWFASFKKKSEVEIIDSEINGYRLANDRKFDEALIAYGKASEADPTNAYIYVNQGKIFMEKKDTKNALVMFEKAAEVNSGDSGIRMVLGNAYKETKQLDKAVIEYKKASELAPNDFYLHFGLLTTFQQMGKQDLAKAEEAQLQKIAKAMEEQRAAQAAQQKQLADEQKAAEEAAKKAAPAKKK